MLDFTEYTKIFISLFAIIDPVGIIPIIIAFTAGMSAQKRERVGRVASLSVFGILLAALLLGEAILSFFGISIHSNCFFISNLRLANISLNFKFSFHSIY